MNIAGEGYAWLRDHIGGQNEEMRRGYKSCRIKSKGKKHSEWRCDPSHVGFLKGESLSSGKITRHIRFSKM